MPFPGTFLRLVMQGTTYPGEIFTTSLSIVPVGSTNLPQPVDISGYVDVCAAWFASSGARIPSLVKLTTVKVNRIGPDGKYVDQGATFLEDLDPVVSGSSSGAVPPQLTLAVTLETAKQRGIGARGRVFPPLAAPSIGSDGLVSQTTCLEIANAFTTFVTSLNALPDPGVVGIASDVREGAFVPVTQVSVGRTIDTQRRRRSKSNDERVLAGVPVPQ